LPASPSMARKPYTSGGPHDLRHDPGDLPGPHGKTPDMRVPALLLPVLVALLACKSDSGGETGASNSSTGDCGAANPDAVDPNYWPCDCDYTCADVGSMCSFSQGSSVCFPACTLGPSCGNPDDPCTDSDCPPLSGITPVCLGGQCRLGCSDSKPCPAGYVCGGGNSCEVEL